MSHTAIDVSRASSSRVSESPLCQGALPVGRNVSGRSTSVQYLDPWMCTCACACACCACACACEL